MKQRVPIWTYWENRPGSSLPDWIGLCLESIDRHAGDFDLRVLDSGSVGDWLDLPDAVREMRNLAAKSDYVRAHLLAEHGGLWLDADTIAFESLSEVAGRLAQHEVVSAGREIETVVPGFVAARAGSTSVRRWAEEQDALIQGRNSGDELDWGVLGPPLATSCLGGADTFYFPLNRVLPIRWRQAGRFLSRVESAPTYLGRDPLVICLFNSQMCGTLDSLNREEVLASPWLVGRLLRCALGMSRPEDEATPRSIQRMNDVLRWRAWQLIRLRLGRGQH